MANSPPQPQVGVALRQGLGNQDGINVLQLAGVKIFLRLCFTDPEGTKRFFPPELPVRVEFSGGGTARAAQCTLGNNGRLTFLAQGNAGQAWRQFTLRFPANPANPRYVVYEARGEPPSPPGSPPAVPRVVDNPPATQERFFKLPVNFGAPSESWALKHSDWTPGAGANAFPAHATFTANTGIVRHNQDPPLDIGTVDQPVELILNPHWKFFRFEFFDRYYGPASRGSPARPSHGARISIPPVALEGLRGHPNAAGADPIETVSNWTIDDGANRLLQCLPWIVRRDHNHHALPHLTGANLGLRIRTAAHSYVYSQSDTVREIRTVAPGDAALNPGPDRLRYYDLPETWKSRRYYTRNLAGSPPNNGKFFQNLTQGDVDRSNARGTPLVFCLDDIVLCDPTAAGDYSPLAGAGNDRVAIFHHRFDNSAAGASNHGIYDPLPIGSATDALDLPRTRGTPTNNYLFDYPDWTRVIAARGCLFDVFDQRCPDHATASRVVGARAAVRWVDTTEPLPGINTDAVVGAAWVNQPDRHPIPGRRLSGTPARTDVPAANPLFSIQPFFSQRMSEREEPFDPAHEMLVGRWDIALLRCCDTAGSEEIAVNFHYFRSFYKFTAPPANAATHLNAGQQRQYALNISMNVANRWNGNDPGVSESRVELLPRGGSPPAPLKVYVVWFPQSVAENRAHFRIQVLRGAGRDNRGSLIGVGDSGESSDHSEGAAASDRFASAHETGHMNGLPDEYNERWNAASYWQLSFWNLMPGDPFEPDGRNEQSTEADAGMMNSNRRIRNRYLWHHAEWVRMVTGTQMKVKYTDPSGPVYDDYWLPEHPQTATGRTYYDWPLLAMLNHPAAAPACDLYLYRLGKDRYSRHILSTIATPAALFALASPPPARAARTFDGILVIGIRIQCVMPDDPNLRTETDNRVRFLAQFAGLVRQCMNYRFYATGNLAAPAVNFVDGCLIQFAPNFLVTNFPNYGPNQAPAQPRRTVAGIDAYVDIDPQIAVGILAAYGSNASLAARFQPPAASNWNAATRTLSMDINLWGDISAQVETQFPRLLNIAKTMSNVTAPDLEPLVRTIFPLANVRPL